MSHNTRKKLQNVEYLTGQKLLCMVDQRNRRTLISGEIIGFHIRCFEYQMKGCMHFVSYNTCTDFKHSIKYIRKHHCYFMANYSKHSINQYCIFHTIKKCFLPRKFILKMCHNAYLKNDKQYLWVK